MKNLVQFHVEARAVVFKAVTVLLAAIGRCRHRETARLGARRFRVVGTVFVVTDGSLVVSWQTNKMAIHSTVNRLGICRR